MSVLKVMGNDEYITVLSNNQKKFEDHLVEIQDYRTIIAFSDGTVLRGDWAYRLRQYKFTVLNQGTDFRRIDPVGSDDTGDFPLSEVVRLSGENLEWVVFGYEYHKGS